MVERLVLAGAGLSVCAFGALVRLVQVALAAPGGLPDDPAALARAAGAEAASWPRLWAEIEPFFGRVTDAVTGRVTWCVTGGAGGGDSEAQRALWRERQARCRQRKRAEYQRSVGQREMLLPIGGGQEGVGVAAAPGPRDRGRDTMMMIETLDSKKEDHHHARASGVTGADTAGGAGEAGAGQAGAGQAAALACELAGTLGLQAGAASVAMVAGWLADGATAEELRQAAQRSVRHAPKGLGYLGPVVRQIMAERKPVLSEAEREDLARRAEAWQVARWDWEDRGRTGKMPLRAAYGLPADYPLLVA